MKKGIDLESIKVYEPDRENGRYTVIGKAEVVKNEETLETEILYGIRDNWHGNVEWADCIPLRLNAAERKTNFTNISKDHGVMIMPDFDSIEYHEEEKEVDALRIETSRFIKDILNEEDGAIEYIDGRFNFYGKDSMNRAFEYRAMSNRYLYRVKNKDIYNCKDYDEFFRQMLNWTITKNQRLKTVYIETKTCDPLIADIKESITTKNMQIIKDWIDGRVEVQKIKTVETDETVESLLAELKGNRIMVEKEIQKRRETLQ